MTPLLAANWKMNLSAAEADSLTTLSAELASKFRGELWLAPPFPWLDRVCQRAKNTKLKVGAQNVCWAENGAFTGEASVSMLRELGASFAIIGHSERRHIAGESQMLCRKRCSFALSCGFGVIFCVGETQAEREAGKTTSVITAQLKGLNLGDENLVIAYEPVWAIGTGVVATSEQITETVSEIAKIASDHSPKTPRILYGGSVTPDNISAIMKIKNISGALVGGASIDPKKLKGLVEKL
jgi:triosephosphate isomerase